MITSYLDAGFPTVALDGDVDVLSAPAVAAALDDCVEHGQRYVRLDLSRLTFLDCAGLGVLVAAHHRYLAAGGTLIISKINAATERLLRLTQLDQVLLLAAEPSLP